MPQSKYFPNLENGVNDADVEQVEQAFSYIETDMNKKLETVTNSDIIDGAVTENKIADGSVSNDKLSSYMQSVISGKAEQVDLERLHYYGDKDIIPSDESYFTVNSTGETITGLTDTGKTQTELVIPYKINGKEITTLSGNNSSSILDGNSVITKVVIPNSVTNIGESAFNGCTSLTSINIPNSVTSIRSSTFRGCSSLTSINIPNSVTYIDTSAFFNCTALKSIKIPNSVTSIEFSAFYGCTALTKIEIPNSVTSIGGGAFQGCTNLTIYCEQGSYAETYAKNNGIPVMYTDISATDFNNKADKATISDLKQKSIPHTTASGYPLTVTDHLEGETVINYQVYGNSVQDGTPTPETPIEIQSVGDLVTDETSEYYGKYDVPVNVCGKNLLPNSDWMSGSHTTGFTEQTEVDYITEYTKNSISFNLPAWTGVSSPRFLKDSVKRIVFKINQNAIISDGYTNFYIIIQGYDNDNNKTGNQIIYNNAVADTEYVFDISTISSYGWYDNSTQFSFCILSRKNALNNLMVYDIAYYTETDTTVYEPYIVETKNIYLNEPLRKVGDYADYVDFENQRAVRKIEVLDNTGTKTIDESLGILSTPTEEPITVPELTALNSAVMHISSGTATQPSQIDLTYYQDINKVITNLTNAILAQGGNV